MLMKRSPLDGRAPGAPRVPPLPPSEWPAPLRALLADSQKDGAGRVNLFGTLAHHPALAHAWLSLARVLTHEGTLGDRRRELVVLRTAHRLGGTFVHERHRTQAARAGLTTGRSGPSRRTRTPIPGRRRSSPCWRPATCSPPTPQYQKLFGSGSRASWVRSNWSSC